MPRKRKIITSGWWVSFKKKNKNKNNKNKQKRIRFIPNTPGARGPPPTPRARDCGFSGFWPPGGRVPRAGQREGRRGGGRGGGAVLKKTAPFSVMLRLDLVHLFGFSFFCSSSFFPRVLWLVGGFFLGMPKGKPESGILRGSP